MACTMLSCTAGWWRGSSEVAVKVFATPPAFNKTGPNGEPAESAPALPAKALAEAMLARDLSHPNIVRT
jgi:hypothetical protein